MELWSVRYDGPAHATDATTAIAVDNQGNVYVTGTSGGVGTWSDIATIKYSPTGEQMWVARYNRENNLLDAGVAVGVDHSGNVCVTGYTTNGGAYYLWTRDIVTIKYNSAGVQEWVAMYNNPSNFNDEPSSLALDSQGNVYVIGSSIDSITMGPYGYYVTSHFVTLKYAPHGNLQWAASYNLNDTSYADGKYIAVDNSGNVTIAGDVRTGYWWWQNPTMSFAVVRYSPDGAQQWADVYNNRPEKKPYLLAQMSSDSSGNIYVCGIGNPAHPEVPFGNELVTMKYQPSGTREWISHFNFDGQYRFTVAGLSINRSGNVFIGGQCKSADIGFAPYKVSDTTFVLKLNANGNQEWLRKFEAKYSSYSSLPSFSMSKGKDVSLTFPTGTPENSDFTTIGLDETGGSYWRATKSGEGSSDESAYLAELDRVGNIYVCGMGKAIGSSFDIITKKFDPDGNLLWTARYDGPAHHSEAPSAMRVDSLGNVFVTGTSFNSSYSADYVTIKYDAAGNQEWASRYAGGSYVAKLVLDKLGNVYVSGETGIVKYNSLGQQTWTSNRPTYSIGTDRNSNLYYFSRGGQYPTYPPDTLVKRNYENEVVWRKYLYNINEFIVDDLGTTYLSKYNYPNSEFFKIDSSGTILWTTSPPGYNIKLDSQGNTYGIWDMKFRKIRSNGTLAWQNADVSLGAIFDYQIRENGDVVAVGLKYPSQLEIVPALGSVDSNGQLLWSARFDNGTKPYEEAFGIRTGSNGSVYVVGNGQREDFSTFPVLIKYGTGPLSVDEGKATSPTTFSLSQNYPNPFNPSTTINYGLPQPGHVSVVVFDILGRRVIELVNEEKPEGYHSVVWNANSIASGMYICRLQAGASVLSRRMMVVK
jgi:hypothetical protein